MPDVVIHCKLHHSSDFTL